MQTIGLTVIMLGKIEPSAIVSPSIATHPQRRIDHRHLVIGRAHLARSERVVHRVVDGAPVARQFLVALELRPRGDLALDPALERLGGRHLARELESVDDRLRVVPVLIHEVAEIERRLDLRIAGEQPHPPDRA